MAQTGHGARASEEEPPGTEDGQGSLCVELVWEGQACRGAACGWGTQTGSQEMGLGHLMCIPSSQHGVWNPVDANKLELKRPNQIQASKSLLHRNSQSSERVVLQWKTISVSRKVAEAQVRPQKEGKMSDRRS